jgi:hypothetical protein
MEALHDWVGDECVAILRAIRRAAHESSRLLIIEGVITEEKANPRASTLDIIMLTITGERERMAAEFSALLEQASFRLDRVIPTASPVRIIKARPICPLPDPRHGGIPARRSASGTRVVPMSRIGCSG